MIFYAKRQGFDFFLLIHESRGIFFYLFPLKLDNTRFKNNSGNQRLQVRLLVRLKMKSLTILLVLFAISLAIRIKEYEPTDTIVRQSGIMVLTSARME